MGLVYIALSEPRSGLLAPASKTAVPDASVIPFPKRSRTIA
jgi:hypothetical protein